MTDSDRTRAARLPVRPRRTPLRPGRDLLGSLSWSAMLVAATLGVAACAPDAEEPPADAVPQDTLPPDTLADPMVDTPVTPPPDPDTLQRGDDTVAAADTIAAADTMREERAELPRAETAQRREEGIVGVTGTGVAPATILRLTTGGSLGLTGALARELRRLAGARVRVEGRDAATPIGPGLEVHSYSVVEIEGREPRVGILQLVENTWRLVPEDDEPLQLEGLPERGVAEGMKIWVLGEELPGDRFRVESHGVIAPVG